jgi:ATP adenylyltransferase/5',5'''-P-1,P-4-tetraphosphate phosphorylase II
MARPHLLLLTKDGFCRQYEPLELDDLKAARRVLTHLEDAFQSPFMIFFNCGIDAGPSRMHKHMQALPHPGFQNSSLFQRMSATTDGEGDGIPFWAFMRQLKDLSSLRDENLHVLYRGLLQEVHGILGTSQNTENGRCFAHNVIMVRDCLMVIPRRRARLDDAAVNAPGMLGFVWLSKEEELDSWMKIGPTQILKEVGISRELP